MADRASERKGRQREKARNNLLPGLIGIALVVAFLAITLVKVPAIPLIVIAVGVCALMVRDFVRSLREGPSGE